MSPLDWLRAKARHQRPPATGGYIDTSTTLLPSGAGCDYVLPSTPELPPGVTVTFHPDSTPPPQLVRQMAEALGVDAHAKPSRERTAELTRQATARAKAELRNAICPCVAIYSTCHYPEQHSKPLQRRP